MVRTDHAPDDAGRDQAGDRVAGGYVHLLDLVARYVGHTRNNATIVPDRLDDSP